MQVFEVPSKEGEELGVDCSDDVVVIVVHYVYPEQWQVVPDVGNIADGSTVDNIAVHEVLLLVLLDDEMVLLDDEMVLRDDEMVLRDADVMMLCAA